MRNLHLKGLFTLGLKPQGFVRLHSLHPQFFALVFASQSSRLGKKNVVNSQTLCAIAINVKKFLDLMKNFKYN